VAKLGRLATDLTLAGHVENPSALMSLNWDLVYASLTARAETPMREPRTSGLDSTRATQNPTISAETRTTAQIFLDSGFLAWHASQSSPIAAPISLPS
jgi:hypothetical protein